MFEKLWIAAAFSLALGLMVWCVLQFMATPVRFGKNTRCSVVVTTQGREPRLEQTVRSLVWLNENGILRCRVILAPEDADEETLFVARALARDHACITLTENGEMPEWIRKTNC